MKSYIVIKLRALSKSFCSISVPQSTSYCCELQIAEEEEGRDSLGAEARSSDVAKQSCEKSSWLLPGSGRALGPLPILLDLELAVL